MWGASLLGYRQPKNGPGSSPGTRLLAGCHPDPALREKDHCHFAQGKLRGESRHWIEETLFDWTSALPRSFVVPIKSGLLRMTAWAAPDPQVRNTAAQDLR
jgi:hypothetical protein